jgi:hypothetical protein
MHLTKDQADRIAEEKDRARTRVEGQKGKTLTDATNEFFPVRKCSVSRTAARALIKSASRFNRLKRISGRATRPSHPNLTHAQEMERRKANRSNPEVTD